MSVQKNVLQSWIDPNLYNQFPSVEDARNSISEADQIAIGKNLGAFISELITEVGTTLTHGHHGLIENESIIGKLCDGSLVSKPRERTIAACPIAWVATPEGLFATEAIDNPSQEVLRVVTMVQKNALEILQHLPLGTDEKFSKLSVTVDPRVVCNTDYTYFVEKNDRDISILTPQPKKEFETRNPKMIATFKSIDFFEVGNKTPATWCSSDCLPYKGNHYYSHMKE